MKIINDKLKGKKTEVPEVVEPEPTNVLDLMTRLQESLSQGKPKKKASETKAAPAERSKAGTAEAKPKKRRKTA